MSRETVDTIIATLNQMDVGGLDAIRLRLVGVREELARRGLSELVEKVDECAAALERGDLAAFRRLRATMVSRLGHLR